MSLQNSTSPAGTPSRQLHAVASAESVAMLRVGVLLLCAFEAVVRITAGPLTLSGDAGLWILLVALLLTLVPRGDAHQNTLLRVFGAVCLGFLVMSAHRLISEPLEWWSLPFTSTVVELLAPLAFVSRRFRMVFVPSLLVVHVALPVSAHRDLSALGLLMLLCIDSARWSPRRPAVDAHGAPQPSLVFFDGVCGLCNRFVDFLVARDHGHALRFASLQGATASSITNMPNVDSVIVADGNVLRIRSEGAIAALSRLGGLWSCVAVFGLIPAPIRDAVYAFIARNRYRWFGKHDACRLPTAAEQHWFLP